MPIRASALQLSLREANAEKAPRQFSGEILLNGAMPSIASGYAEVAAGCSRKLAVPARAPTEQERCQSQRIFVRPTALFVVECPPAEGDLRLRTPVVCIRTLADVPAVTAND